MNKRGDSKIDGKWINKRRIVCLYLTYKWNEKYLNKWGIRRKDECLMVFLGVRDSQTNKRVIVWKLYEQTIKRWGFNWSYNGCVKNNDGCDGVGNHSHTIKNRGGGQPHNHSIPALTMDSQSNLPPYITVYMYKRIA